MRKTFTNSRSRSLHKLIFAISLLMIASINIATAQLGSGWKIYSPSKRIHLDDVEGLQTFTWTSYKSVCTPTMCADYSYNSGDNSETFRIFDSRSNRSEIRLVNEYKTGSRQFEGYVTIYAPLHDESLMQIFGSTSGATQMMLRGYRDNNGSLRRSGGKTVATNIYGKEVKVNIIHLQEDVGNKIQIYIDDVKMDEFADNEPVENYQKYGCYGTTSGNVPAIVKWRNVRVFRDGISPDQGTYVNITSPASGATFASPANITIEASAFDVDGAIGNVEFYKGGTKLGDDTTSPYSFTWNGAPIGTHTLTAKFTSVTGATVTSPAVVVTVTAPQGPYLGIVRTIPGKIQGEDYDEGGQGVAYHDTTVGNTGNAYRTDNVDVQPCLDAGGGFNLAFLATGEWVEYTVNVETEATYTLDLRVAATTSTRALHVEVDGVNITGTVPIPNTGAFQTYQTVSRVTPVLTTGQHIVRLHFETPSHNVNWFEFKVKQRTQKITFQDIEDARYGEVFPLVVNSGSGLPVSVQVLSGPAQLNDGFLTLTGVGEVKLKATQAGNADYLAASAEYAFTVQKADQIITLENIGTKTYGDAPFELIAQVDSGLPLTFTVTSGPATISGSTLTIDGAGDVTVGVSQEGNENYNPASVGQTFTVNKAAQTISFFDITPKYISETVELFATATSGLDVSFEIVEGPGMIANNVLSFTDQGEVTIQAIQAGNENYLPAAAVQQTVLVYADDAKKDGLLLIVNPNPTRGKVMVKLANKKDKDYAFAVYDKFGQIVGSSIIDKSHKMFEIDFQYEENGLYFLWVSDGEEVWVRRIVKE